MKKVYNKGNKNAVKEVHQYDLKKNYIQTFPSVNAAAESIKVKACTLSHYIRTSLHIPVPKPFRIRNVKRSTDNFIWSFEKRII